MPWDWRRGHRVARHDEASARADGCVIKGNINQQRKKIYHVPGGRWYEQTRIDESSAGSVPRPRPEPPDGAERSNE
jgi:hypothetical protein